MGKLFHILKTIVGHKPGPSHGQRRQRRDPRFVGRSSAKEIEQASPERVGELVGHAVERVDT